MLHDMPKRQGAALVAHPGDGVAEIIDPPAKRSKVEQQSRRLREKVVRPSALGMLLRPIGVSIAIVLSTYALLSLGTTFYKSYQRHLDI